MQGMNVRRILLQEIVRMLVLIWWGCVTRCPRILNKLIIAVLP